MTKTAANTKKANQLGMPHGTAANRLVKDLLFHLATNAGYVCYRCGGDLTRDQFTIEHKEAWLDTDDPIGKFFDLDNIAFSHHKCNVAAARRPSKLLLSKEERRKHDNQIEKERWQRLGAARQKQIRRQKYQRYGA